MKKAAAVLGVILLVLGMGMSWLGNLMGGATRATVRLFGHSMEITAPGMLVSSWQIEEPSRDLPLAVTEIADPGTSQSVSAFSSVSIDLDMGDVTIAAADDYMVCVNNWGPDYNVFWDNTDGQLLIWSESGMIGPNHRGSSVTVYVPADTRLEFISANIDLGNLTLAGLTALHLSAELDLGNLTGEGLTVIGDLVAGLDMGNIVLYGDLGELVDVSTDLGDITLGLSRSASDYWWDLSADMGSITVDGKVQGDGVSSSVSAGYGNQVILADTSLGSISLEFDCPQKQAGPSVVSESEAVTAVEDVITAE